jgi:hypothetical protein
VEDVQLAPNLKYTTFPIEDISMLQKTDAVKTLADTLDGRGKTAEVCKCAVSRT